MEALRQAQPRDLDASEIEVRLGATWIDPSYIREFMWETFETPFYQQRMIDVNYSAFTAEWNIRNKNAVSYSNIAAYMTYGTERANAYKILEDTLNLRDVRIYDTKHDADGRGAARTQLKGNHPRPAEAAGYPGCFPGLDMARPRQAAHPGRKV